MHIKFAASLLAFGSSASAFIMPRIPATNNLPTSRRCGEGKPTDKQLKQSLNLYELETADMARTAKAARIYDQDIEVNVYVHVVSSHRTKFISPKQVRDQMDYLNKAYKPYDISFNHLDTNFVVNGNWSTGFHDDVMMKHLRRGSYKDLNLYFIDTPRYEDEVAYGVCSFPHEDGKTDKEILAMDGCRIMAETVPGGTAKNFNMGGTAVHEVGHWFHLFHTFDGGCDGSDEVWDTPAQESPSDGCPKMRDSCPGKPGIDPIHNFMDYSYDSCYEGFSLGQRRRMHSSFHEFRV